MIVLVRPEKAGKIACLFFFNVLKIRILTTIADYLEKAIFVRNSIPSEVDRIIEQNKPAILDLNRERQLYDKGIDATGNMLRSYSPFTIALKKQKGEVYNRTTLLDTGAFYRRFDLLVRDGKVSFFSRDPKSEKLQDDYGEAIFGLTAENQKVMNEEIIKPRLAEYITKYL